MSSAKMGLVFKSKKKECKSYQSVFIKHLKQEPVILWTHLC